MSDVRIPVYAQLQDILTNHDLVYGVTGTQEPAVEELILTLQTTRNLVFYIPGPHLYPSPGCASCWLCLLKFVSFLLDFALLI